MLEVELWAVDAAMLITRLVRARGDAVLSEARRVHGGDLAAALALFTSARACSGVSIAPRCMRPCSQNGQRWVPRVGRGSDCSPIQLPAHLRETLSQEAFRKAPRKRPVTCFG